MYWGCSVNILSGRKLWLLIVTLLIPVFAWSYDPMAPPGYQQLKPEYKSKVKKTSAQTGYILRQIVISQKGKSAVINGYVVNEGSYLKNAVVKSIQANKVILKVSGKEQVLYLNPESVRVRR